jgi:hypothetical protein
VGEKLAGVGKLVPDLGEKRGPMGPRFENDPIDPGLELNPRVVFGRELQGRLGRKEGYLHPKVGELGPGYRRKPGIGESGGPGVVADIVNQGASGFEASDATTKEARFREGHKGCSRHPEPLGFVPRLRWSP